MNRRQKNPAVYRLAADDSDFLRSDVMRGTHLLLEYSKAEVQLEAWDIASTVVVFGSARARPADPQLPELSHWYEEARRFGRIVSERGGALQPQDGVRRNVIATGGGPGLMEAANRGAHEAGAPTIGFNIQLPVEQRPNPYSTPDLTFQFHFFAIRKMHLALRAAALIVFPGGLGTFDELFEILTLAQTGKVRKLPILCFGREFWTRAVNFDYLTQYGVISPQDREAMEFVDDAEEAWTRLLAGGILLPDR